MAENQVARYSKHSPTDLSQWQALQAHSQEMLRVHMRDLFKEDPDRATRFSLELKDLFIDFSKNLISGKTLKLLQELAHAAGIKQARTAMFGGEKINWTEGRAVLHVALRRRSREALMYEGQDIMPEIRRVLEKIRDFSSGIRSGRLKGATGKAIESVVNIGIGGSDLGPHMISEALHYYHDGPDLYFVSNIDATDFVEKTRFLDPETTLFIIASKTFTTQETMTNAHTARRWILDAIGQESAVGRHFAALSTNSEAVAAFGIDPSMQFEFWDWVGGRYSSWSAVGLSIALGIGFKAFEELLGGAFAMDEHFRRAPLEENIPVILALLGIWNRNFLGMASHAILPYEQYLHRFAAHFQQVDMESNGKRVDRDGKLLDYDSGPIIWGEPGTNGQHAFFQLIHQGTQTVPCDFIAFIRGLHPIGDHHRKLMANFLAQTEALMRGRTMDEIEDDCPAELRPHKIFPGNRPSTTILLDQLNPRSLGMLIAMYEHKIFVQGAIWRINSFDQFGVELGKKLAGSILPEAEKLARGENPDLSAHDSSTRALMLRIFKPDQP